MEENNEIFEEVYPYQVNTRMPIVGLTVGTLKVPTTVKLTKEDVLICMKKAPVFRRFPNGLKERVSTNNIDRLHREKFISVEEYEKMIDKENDHRGEVKITDIKETPIVETPKVVEELRKEEPVVEEIKPEIPVVEEVKEEVNDIKEEEINKIEDVSEEVTEEAAEVELKSTEENRNNRYNNKKKHNH